MIRSVDDPYRKDGGIAILRGNLAPDGAVVKQSAVAAEDADARSHGARVRLRG